ncbi:MAG: GerMN domain-containing protein [Firmicutes bacterium]|nr:GerMN domain-containing protein [Bacillota bacterium]
MSLLFVPVVLGGCNGNRDNQGPAGTNAPSSQPPGTGESTPQPQKMDVAVYYVKFTEKDAYLVREVHQVPYSKEVARAALEELVNGTPTTPGAVKVLPQGTKILGITVRNGLATVDFSRDVLRANQGATGEAMGIQSIVNTLTEFPTVQKVSFLVEGKVDQRARDWWGHVGLYNQPFTRDISRVYEPVIWVTAPVKGQKITSPVTVKGTARVFEASVSVRLKDESGNVIARGFTTATQGAPGHGDFVITLPFTASPGGKGTLEIYWTSPNDGSELNVVAVPVTW